MRIFLLFTVLLLLGCDDNENPITPSTSENQVVPIGDSRIDGARPEFESYRYELWKLLVDAEVTFDLVGPYDDSDHEGSYSDYQGQEFDDDHAGIGGFQTEDVLETMDRILQASPKPDIVLLGIGGNDLLNEDPVEKVIANIHQIIDQLQSANDSVVIVLEQIAPGLSSFMTNQLTASFNEFNEQIVSVGQQQSTQTSPVIVVNMAEGWQDSYMADDVHYNEAGARVVAQRYFDVFIQYLQD